MKAWHFTGDTLRDGTPIPAPGETLAHPGPLVMCESGLHASLHPFDALKYAPGDKLHLVECEGEVIHDDDKLVCSRRTIIASMNAQPLLRYYARLQALSVAHLWDAPDIVLDYLMTGDDAARDAALDAARVAARAAPWDAALDAARAATALAAARVAALDAALNAALDTARADFQSLVHESFADWL